MTGCIALLEQPRSKQSVYSSTQPALASNLHIVHKGDTMSTIAAKHGITIHQLNEANSVYDWNKIRIGQRLNIPLVESRSDQHATFVSTPLSPVWTDATCAVLTFDAVQGVTEGESRILTDRFSVELNRLGVTILSRSKMNEILRAQDFSRSDICSSTECAIEIGKILAVSHIAYGSVGKIGATYTINCNLANVESSAIDASTTYDHEEDIDGFLTRGMSWAAARLLGVPPPGEKPETPPQVTVHIIGEVRHPGTYQMPQGSTALQAVAMAGGYTPFANPRKAKLLRHSGKIPLNFQHIERRPGSDPRLFDNDTVNIPRSIF